MSKNTDGLPARTSTLGIIAMVCSPFLCTDFLVNSLQHPNTSTSSSGVFSLIYMTGWMCSLIALFKQGYFGKAILSRPVFYTQITLLSLAQAWNIYTIFDPNANTILYRTLDVCWPLSNCFMFITGILVLVKTPARGWRQLTPLLCGLWLPVTVFVLPLILKNNSAALIASAIYSLITWFVMGFAVYSSDRQSTSRPEAAFV